MRGYNSCIHAESLLSLRHTCTEKCMCALLIWDLHSWEELLYLSKIEAEYFYRTIQPGYNTFSCSTVLSKIKIGNFQLFLQYLRPTTDQIPSLHLEIPKYNMTEAVRYRKILQEGALVRVTSAFLEPIPIHQACGYEIVI